MFQSTPPEWGATREPIAGPEFLRVSIHAPRVGSDVCSINGFYVDIVSIHAPRVGSDM